MICRIEALESYSKTKSELTVSKNSRVMVNGDIGCSKIGKTEEKTVAQPSKKKKQKMY